MPGYLDGAHKTHDVESHRSCGSYLQRHLCVGRFGRNKAMMRRYCTQYILTCCIASILLIQVIRMFLPPNLTRGADCIEKRNYRPAIENEYPADDAKISAGVQSRDEFTVPRCDVVQIASRCYGEEEIYNLTLMIKSVLFFTRSAVKFHIVTNTAGQRVLETFIDSWELQHVAVLYYISPKTRVIEFFMKSPPVSSEHLLILKPSAMMLSDVTHFWHLAKSNASKHTVIRGIDSHYITVSETKDVPQNHKPQDHSIEGVILNLSELRHKNLCVTLGAGSLEEIRPDYAFIYNVACKDSRTANIDPDIMSVPRIVQTGIVDMTSLDERFLPEMVRHVISLHGDTLRNRLVDNTCSWIYTKDVVQFDQTELLDDYCYDYRYQACISRRTHLYFNHHVTAQADDVTTEISMVTQLQYNRLPGLLKLLDTWAGPVQVTMYLSDEEVRMFSRDIKRFRSLLRHNVFIHVVYRRQIYYPINKLRNIALKEVKTSHVFVIDVDFVPMPGLHEKLRDYITYMRDHNKTNRAIIVPTFETFDVNYAVPRNKKDFIRDIHLGIVEPYHQGSFWSFKLGHKPHNYPKWFDANSPYMVEWMPKFEPYIVLPTSDSPLYEEILVERMQDKMPYTLEIVIKGYTFFVLHDAFMVHFPHERSVSHTWSKDPKFYWCATYFYDTVAKKIKNKYEKPKKISADETTLHSLAAS